MCWPVLVCLKPSHTQKEVELQPVSQSPPFFYSSLLDSPPPLPQRSQQPYPSGAWEEGGRWKKREKKKERKEKESEEKGVQGEKWKKESGGGWDQKGDQKRKRKKKGERGKKAQEETREGPLKKNREGMDRGQERARKGEKRRREGEKKQLVVWR